MRTGQRSRLACVPGRYSKVRLSKVQIVRMEAAAGRLIREMISQCSEAFHRAISSQLPDLS